MPSPFPGMNPYLEQPDVWHDFHQRFIARMGDEVACGIRPAYVTKVDENVYIHELDSDQRLLLGRPDVAVLEGAGEDAGPRGLVATASQALTIGKLLPTTDRIGESFIEIRDAQDRDLITVIELLSPTNKRPGTDREHYLAKRRLLLSGNVHLVEIDLLRGNSRMPIDGLSDCHYCVMVSRSYQRPHVELWPLGLRDSLPIIPIPLKREDPDASLNLQQLLHEQYDAAGYDDYIYRGTPRPPLFSADAKWADEVLRQRAESGG